MTSDRAPVARPSCSLGRCLVRAAAVGAMGGLGLLAYIGAKGSRELVYGDGVPRSCRTPAAFGWPYEAVNYDIADDARLEAVNADWSHGCADQGAGTAGTEVVSSDGIRLAGWYIPAATGNRPSAPVVVLVHGWCANKSDALRYAVVLHDRFDLLLPDLRASGRSSGAEHTVGVKEWRDLEAMLDWLERVKRPSRIGVLGDSGGGPRPPCEASVC